MGISIAVTVGNATKQADVAGIRGRGVKRASIEFDADSAGRHELVIDFAAGTVTVQKAGDVPAAAGKFEAWGNGLDAGRRAKAEAAFQESDLDGYAVKEAGNWKDEGGNRWTKVFSTEEEAGRPSVRKVFAVEFYPGLSRLLSAAVEG